MFENNNFFQKKRKCLVAMVTEQNHSHGYNMSYMSDGLILCVNVYVNAMNEVWAFAQTDQRFCCVLNLSQVSSILSTHGFDQTEQSGWLVLIYPVH